MIVVIDCLRIKVLRFSLDRYIYNGKFTEERVIRLSDI